MAYISRADARARLEQRLYAIHRPVAWWCIDRDLRAFDHFVAHAEYTVYASPEGIVYYEREGYIGQLPEDYQTTVMLEYVLRGYTTGRLRRVFG